MLAAGALSSLVAVCGPGSTQAQESIRMSLSGADAAEARRTAQMTPGYYNVNWGMTWWRFGAGLGTEFNDNVYYTDDAKSDFIIRPSANMQFFWPATEQNSLNLRVDGGYAAYMQNSDLSRFFITPGSELAFDVYVGKVWLNLHDRFSIIQDAYMDPTWAGSGDYSRLENAVGIGALWDLNKIVLRGGYDHVNYISLASGDRSYYPDGQNEIFYTAAGYEVWRQTSLGVEAGLGLVDYEPNDYIIFTEAVQWNTGLFVESPVSEHIKVELGAGYTQFNPEYREGVTLDDSLDGFYGRATIRHRLNQYVDYSLSGGRNISFTFYGGTIDLYYARLQANWHVLEKITLSTSFDYDGGTQYDYGKEEFDRFGGGISAARNITEKLSASLGYRIYVRDSDLSYRTYTVNIVSANVSYKF